MERTRTRTKVQSPVLEQVDQYYDYPPTYGYVLPVNRETTIDEEHPWYAWLGVVRNPLSRGYTTGVEVGGEFTSVKTDSWVKPVRASLRAWPHQGRYLYNYDGHLIPQFVTLSSKRADVTTDYPMKAGAGVQTLDYKSAPSNWGSVPTDTDEELAVLGASLVSKLAPTAPHNNVYTSLGELRNDGLPSIPFLSFLKKGGGGIPEKVGGEYLNYQFGIAPTISDVKSILETVSKADKLWKQYLRDSGRLVRRRMDMDPVVETTTEVFAQPSYAIPYGTTSYHWSSIGPVTVTTTTTRKRWFSAAYLYYVDKTSLAGMEGWLDRAQYLYGWKPSPSGVYNLTAWSWLLDWFTNTGDVIDNISLYLEDPFLVRWAYIMEHSVINRQVSQTVVSNTGQRYLLEVHFKTDIKKRRRVNPFHLGFKGEALNGHQLAILAALGLTKGRDPGLM